MSIEPVGRETVFDGRIFSVHRGRFRRGDGQEVEREWVDSPGAVAIVAYDDEHVHLVRQPREAILRDDTLELPAGRLDREGEDPEETARRELAEEVGKEAGSWRRATAYFSSSGFSDELVHVFLATDLRDVPRPDSGEDERIDLVRWPLDDLDGAIDASVDAKTLVGLLWLRRERTR